MAFEELGAELRAEALADFEVLEDRGIPAEDTGTLDLAARGVTLPQWRNHGSAFRLGRRTPRVGKRRRVEPLRHRVRSVDVGIGDLIRWIARPTVTASPEANIILVATDGGEVVMNPGAHVEHTRQLPATQRVTNRSFLIRKER